MALSRLAGAVGRADLQRTVVLSTLLPTVGETRILVMGVVKRGKSTLVNQLLGADVSPVHVLPETVGLIAYESHPTETRAWSADDSGQVRSIPFRESAFKRRVSRGGRSQTVGLAMRVARYNTPVGVTLVDTVGNSEATDPTVAATSAVPDDVVAGASGVIVVFGVPGISDSDVLLLSRVLTLRANASNSVLLVIKSVDSAVKRTDLLDFRAYLMQEQPSLRGVLERAVLVHEGEISALAYIRQWLLDRRNQEPSSRPSRKRATTPRSDSQQFSTEPVPEWEKAISETLRGLATDPTATVRLPKSVTGALPDDLRGLVINLAPGAVARRRSEAGGKRRATQANERGRMVAAWRGERRSLKLEIAELKASIRAARSRASSENRKGAGIGCAGLLVSFAVFPVGPILMLVWAAIRSEENQTKALPHRLLADQLEQALQTAKGQLAIHELSAPRLRDRLADSTRRIALKLKPTRTRWKRGALAIVVVLSLALFAVERGHLVVPFFRSSKRAASDDPKPAESSMHARTLSDEVVGPGIDHLARAGIGDPPEKVLLAQRLLEASGLELTVDGVWGFETQQKMNDFRAWLGLGPGDLDGDLWRRLLARPVPPSSLETWRAVTGGLRIPRQAVWVGKVSDWDMYVFPFRIGFRSVVRLLAAMNESGSSHMGEWTLTCSAEAPDRLLLTVWARNSRRNATPEKLSLVIAGHNGRIEMRMRLEPSADTNC